MITKTQVEGKRTTRILQKKKYRHYNNKKHKGEKMKNAMTKIGQYHGKTLKITTMTKLTMTWQKKKTRTIT